MKPGSFEKVPEWPIGAHLLPTANLLLDPQNARLHPDRNLAVLQESLRRFGQLKPLVIDPDMKVLAGNGLLMAARRLGWERLACVVFRGTPAEAKAYALTDNRSAELSQWAPEQLAASLAELQTAGIETTALGWEPGELALPEGWGQPDGEFDPGNRPALTISLTVEQAAIFTEAAMRVKAESHGVSDGRVVELLAADWLAGA